MRPMVRLRRTLVGEAPVFVRPPEPPILGEEDPPIVGERWTEAEDALLTVEVDVGEEARLIVDVLVGEPRLVLDGDEFSGLLLL